LYLSIIDLIRWFKGDSWKPISRDEVYEELLRYLMEGYFIFDIEMVLNKVKWFVQRGRRGWADCDLWNMDNHLGKVISEMLKELKRIQHGYPAYLEEEEWDEILDSMIKGFELVSDMGNDFIDISFVNSESVKSWFKDNYQREIENDKILKRSLKLFAEHFLNLSD